MRYRLLLLVTAVLAAAAAAHTARLDYLLNTSISGAPVSGSGSFDFPVRADVWLDEQGRMRKLGESVRW